MLQPDHYTSEDLEVLARSGTTTMAYLSLGEDSVPGRPWQRPEVNPLWGVHFVDVSHPGWRKHVLTQARKALEAGFHGLFLDTLDTPDLYPEDTEAMLDLVKSLRQETDDYIVANRGFSLMKPLSAFVDGFLFEGFSTTWQGGYQTLPRERLAENVRICHALQTTRRDLYSLDYAVTEELISFATNRAVTHGLHPQVSNKMLTEI